MASREQLVGLIVMAVLAGAGCGRKKTYLPSLTTPELKALAKRGNAEAAHQLGMRYEAGHGVGKDESEAVKWFTMAAEKGFLPSQFFLGCCYQEGRGVAEDKAKAEEWFAKAAAHRGRNEESRFFAEQARSRLEGME
jgi:TPR repeat protein